MTKEDVARQRAKEWDALANEHWQTTNDQAMDESGPQELLNGDSTVDI
jgi:hypothetical protein